MNGDDELIDPILQIKTDLVCANKVLLRYGVVDAFGHVSVRHPRKNDVFLMAKSVPPGLVRVSDIVQHGLDGELVAQDGSKAFLERFIHSEIFLARPDVQSVVHSHSSNIVAFGVVATAPLRAVCHTCGFLKGGAPLYEIRDFAGDDTNVMIDSREKGRSLVNVLGDKGVVLMRGHGSTAVGSSIAQAVYRAIYTETNARIQATASSLGPVKFLTDGEADACEALNADQVERAWQLWKDQV